MALTHMLCRRFNWFAFLPLQRLLTRAKICVLCRNYDCAKTTNQNPCYIYTRAIRVISIPISNRVQITSLDGNIPILYSMHAPEVRDTIGYSRGKLRLLQRRVSQRIRL